MCRLPVCVRDLPSFLGIDTTLVRLGWVLFTLLGGSGIIAYLICMIVIPTEPTHHR